MLSIIQKIIITSLFLIFFSSESVTAKNNDFNTWLSEFRSLALDKGISEKTLNIAFMHVKFLDQVIKYDRKQPEFFEDTKTYIKKRTNVSRVKNGKILLIKNRALLNQVEDEFNVEKEILLALWGIETNYGKHVGKMDIISCLATLSYDERRSEFFSKQLIILLKLIDEKLIEPSTLYGSWAGAFGNFQFMPSTIKNYAIDYDNNNKIDLKKSLKDSLASAANYINRIGWKKNTPCFYEVTLTKKINKRLINTSARKISNRLKISKWIDKGVLISDSYDINKNYKAALILPDGKPNSPAFLVFHNYEKILKWNRSLRFGITVCTLATMIKT